MDLGHPEEAARSAAPAALDDVGTPVDREFGELTRLAAAALGVACSGLSLVDGRRQWFNARHGIPAAATPGYIAFCPHVVTASEVLVVPDARLDARFAGHPVVAHDGGVRFVAGVPLVAGSGSCIGTLCVYDPAPREGLTGAQRTVLTDLARLAADLIGSRRFHRMGEIAAKVVDATSDAVLAADLDGTIIYWNPAAERMFGRPHADAVGRNVEIIIPPRLAVGHREIFGRAANGGATRLVGKFVELVAARADGSEFPVELSLARWGSAGHEQGFAAIVRDITVRKALEREREHAKSFLDSVISNLPAMLFVKDVDSRRYMMVNQAGEKALGRPASEIVGATAHDLFPAYADANERRDAEAIAAGSHVVESRFTREDGETVHLRTIRTLLDGPDRPNQYLLGVAEDVTAAREAEAQALRLAHYDALTGLLNRASSTDRIHQLVAQGRPFALLSIDLDRFKAVNDQFGHPTGDELLVQVGERLRAVVGQVGWVARVGGDEFVAVLVGDELRDRARNIADAIVASTAMPFATQRGVAHVGASIGAVLMPEDGTTTEHLRANVDLALYRAKQNGRSCACFFNAEMDASAQDRRKIEHDLRNAVDAEEITLAYQPLISARTGRVTSAEALARWTHPTRGPIRPDVFIPLVEECGLIDRLGEQLLRRACRDARTWPEHIRVAVNLSPLQFISNRLVAVVRDALAESGLAPHRLQLEVTEGLVIRDVERTFVQLEQLRDLGIQILIDDFGVGYSSLSYFQRFHFDKVKIDKSFVHDIATSRAAKPIIQAVIGLGEQLGMAVVAEGVETEEQMQMLVALGCTHLQGYLIGKPLPAYALRALVENEALISTTAQLMAA